MTAELARSRSRPKPIRMATGRRLPGVRGAELPRVEVPMIRAKPHATHEVLNQVPPLIRDVADDPALLEGLRREVPPAPEGEPGALGGTAGGANAERELHELGVRAGSPETQELARLANEHPPVLRTHDRYGHRIDEVEFHPAWHELMTTAVEPRAARGALAGRHTGRARGPRRRVLRVDAGRRRARLPGLDDLRRGPAAAARAGARGQVRAAARRPGLRPRAAGARQQGWPAGRHGHDRETGRLRRTGQYHPRCPGRG